MRISDGSSDVCSSDLDLASAKFDETLEIAMNLGVDPRHADQMVRGVVTLPAGTGKDVKVAVFASGDNADKALAAGADKVGAEDPTEDMPAGHLDYGRAIAPPERSDERRRGNAGGRTCRSQCDTYPYKIKTKHSQIQNNHHTIKD